MNIKLALQKKNIDREIKGTIRSHRENLIFSRKTKTDIYEEKDNTIHIPKAQIDAKR